MPALRSAPPLKIPKNMSISPQSLLALSGWGEVFINVHLADQRLAIWQMHRPWTLRTVAPEAGDRSLSPLVSHPAYLTTGRAVFLIASGAAFTLCPGPMGQATTRYSIWSRGWSASLVGRSLKRTAQGVGGGNKPRAVPSLYRAFAPLYGCARTTSSRGSKKLAT